VSVTSNYANFVAKIVIANEARGILVIYGHLKRNVTVNIGERVKFGQIIARQGNTNNFNAPMASHLHIQFQPYGYLREKEFVCNGISAKQIELRRDKHFNGVFISRYNMNVRKPSSLMENILKVVKPNNQQTFNGVVYRDGHYWIKLKEGYISSGTKSNRYGRFN